MHCTGYEQCTKNLGKTIEKTTTLYLEAAIVRHHGETLEKHWKITNLALRDQTPMTREDEETIQGAIGDSYFEDKQGNKVKKPRAERDVVLKVNTSGCIEARLSIEDPTIKIIAPTKMPIETQYGQNFEIELEITSEESKEFYIDFYADDNEVDFEKGEYNKGELENVFCGRVKIVFDVPNVWEFTEEQIMQVKQYAITNNLKYKGRGDKNRYDHCTDTHKHIALQLLKEPQGLDLGKTQDHEATRLTPKDFERAGESTTDGVRSSLISQGYAEPSKVFTVLDINNEEVVRNGKPFNTDKDLSGFKESPVTYLKSKCPTDEYYTFIGAYNADFHSFTIIVAKKEDNFVFFFIDQMVGVVSYDEDTLEQEKLLNNIFDYSYDFPMKLELYQLRNQKQ